jgi:MFS family permease
MRSTKQPLSGDQILGLVAMGLAVLVIANDFTALSVALPAIEAEFKSDVTTVQWIINGYALVFGVLIITGGDAWRICLAGGLSFLSVPPSSAVFPFWVEWRRTSGCC